MCGKKAEKEGPVEVNIGFGNISTGLGDLLKLLSKAAAMGSRRSSTASSSTA
jgi:hypothetical protein